MIVDHINTHLVGGAATAARRLHVGLLRAGVTSRFWHRHPDEMTGPDLTLYFMDEQLHGSEVWKALGAIPRQLGGFGRLRAEWERAMQGRPPGLEQFSLPRLATPTPYWPQCGVADVVHLHWVAHSIDYPSFFASLPADQPVVWTLHDMSAFTGGCHYSNGCDAFVHHCGNCPQLGRRGPRDVSHRMLRVKRKSLRGKNLHIVCPSRWLMHEAARSRVLRHAKTIRHINYGLDLKVYAPQDKVAARNQLELPRNRIVVAFGADSLDNHRKGFSHLLSALEHLDRRLEILGLVFGAGKLPDTSLPFPMRSVGFVSDPVRQAMIYSAADIFVMPSLEDNSPQTGLEAMACGTPVVGFDVGGIPDYVRPFDTGLLANVGDSEDLARKITWIVQHHHQRRQMATNARAMMRNEFRSELQAASYIRLYRDLLAGAAPARRAA